MKVIIIVKNYNYLFSTYVKKTIDLVVELFHDRIWYTDWIMYSMISQETIATYQYHVHIVLVVKY